MRLKLPYFEKPNDSTVQGKIEYLQTLYQSADEMRRKYEPEWYTNCLFLAGRQWEAATEDIMRTRKVTIKAAETKVKLTDNIIYPLARQAVSALVEHLSRQMAVPATEEQEDRDAAELATDFLTAREYTDNEDAVRRNEVLWAMCTGRVLRKTVWDPDLDGEGIQGTMEGAGDISSVTLNPFRFHVCPWADNSQPMPWIIESDVRDIDEINDLYPGSDVTPEETADAARYLDRLLVSVMEDRGMPAGTKKHSAILKRIYIQPTCITRRAGTSYGRETSCCRRQSYPKDRCPLPA
jgi:hypothetical protein